MVQNRTAGAAAALRQILRLCLRVTLVLQPTDVSCSFLLDSTLLRLVTIAYAAGSLLRPVVAINRFIISFFGARLTASSITLTLNGADSADGHRSLAMTSESLNGSAASE